MEDLLKRYIIEEYGDCNFKDILKDNRLEFLYCDKVHNVKYLINKANVMILQKELVKICGLFNECAVPYIAFKGPILANMLYEDIYTRCFGDIDIYVFPREFDNAVSLLLNQGYRYQDSTVVEGAHHIALVKGNIVVELHKNILNPFTEINENYLLCNLGKCCVLNCKIITFDITASFLHLLYHLYMDILLYSKHFFYRLFYRNTFAETKRFLGRAYEIARFSKLYSKSIKWQDILKEFESQRFSVFFKKMIYDIIEIFPETFPQRIMDLVSRINFSKNENYSYHNKFLDIYIGNRDLSKSLSAFVNDYWEGPSELCLNSNSEATYFLSQDETFKGNHASALPKTFGCKCCFSKYGDNLRMVFSIEKNKLCCSKTNQYTTQDSDGVHLIFCGTKAYSYNSIFLMPKNENDKIKIQSYDTLSQTLLNNNLITAELKENENNIVIDLNCSKEFINKNSLSNCFYLGIIIPYCDEQSGKRIGQLSTCDKVEQWFNPIHFLKILI